jgi:hypothetical protein
LNIKENNATTYTMISNDKVTVAVPAAALFAKAGYLDASIMSFVDVFDNVRKKIGSLYRKRCRRIRQQRNIH